ncbi:MAG TPA: VTT domain-containing protein [Polyangia bacterium]|nr:VTT domain-containing protein [Polyangia bacterium]
MILREGRNCWRIARAGRAAFLVDAAAYFAAARHAMAQAQHSIFIVGWDVDSRVRLLAEPASDGRPAELLPFLNSLLTERPHLRAYVLGWDFSMIYTFERERLQWYQFAWRGNRRLRFAFDGVHPFGASHHQKIVVVDDRVAFAGGLDLTIRRWDTPEHRAIHPARLDPAGVTYAPVHDVQMAVDGDAARALGQLARERWSAATGDIARPTPTRAEGDAWPAGLAADVIDVPIGISRTVPVGEAPVVQEVLSLTLDAIAAARQSIYIENQYLTSAAVGSALAARLKEPDGPEVVAVLPREETGWLEKSSMGIMRSRLLRRLLEADRFSRLALYHPTVPDLGDACVNVHAKVLIVDDRVLRIGSSNLSNRSMGVDSECDLVIAGDGQGQDSDRLHATIAGFRNRLLAEHLGVTEPQVAQALARHGSLVAAVQSLRAPRGNARTLKPLPVPDDAHRLPAPPLNLAVFDGLVCDPEHPAPDKLLGEFVPPELRRPIHKSLLGYALVLLVMLGVAALWRLTPLRQFLDVQAIAGHATILRTHPAAPALVLGAYLIGALIFFPITLLLATTALVFEPALGLGYCLVGALSGAALTYGLGRALGRRRMDRWAGPRLRRLRGQLQQRGLLAIVVARVLPVGNFSVINIIAGALPLSFRSFMLGNLIGLLPGILGLTLFADRLAATLRNPRPWNLLVLGLVVIIVLAGLAWVRKRLARIAHIAPVEKKA